MADCDLASSTLVCCIHHRRSPLFESGMAILANAGFNHIWILETGRSAWGNYQGPAERIIDTGIQNVMTGLGILRTIELPNEIDRIMLVDNDLFIFNPADTIEYLHAFEDGNYDIATLHSVIFDLTAGSNETIIPYDLLSIHGQYTIAEQLQPAAIAYSIFRRNLWDKITDPMRWFQAPSEDVWGRFAQLNPKFGVHRIVDDKEIRRMLALTVGSSYAQFRKGEWFHMGNLISSYYNLEGGRFNDLPSLHKSYFLEYFPDRVTSFIDKCTDIYSWKSFLDLVSRREY